MKYKADDILVSLEDTPGGRLKGDILIMRDSTYYYYGPSDSVNCFSSRCPANVRYATACEIVAYKRGIRNIKELTQSLLPIFN